MDELHVDNYGLTTTVPHSQNYTIFLVMSFWRNRKTILISHFIGANINSITGGGNDTKITYNKNTNIMSLISNRGTKTITIPSSFNGKKIVIWLTENSNANITKLAISNYSSTLTQASNPVRNPERKNFGFLTEYGVLYRWMYSINVYDFHSGQCHKILIQEKLNGSYIL